MKFVPKYFLIFLITPILFNSCSEQAPRKNRYKIVSETLYSRDNGQSISDASTEDRTVQTREINVDAQTCAEAIQALKPGLEVAADDAGVWTVSLGAGVIADQVTFVTWIESLADEVFGKRTCPIKSLVVTATGNDATFRGKLLADDENLYLAKRISTAEWTKRLDVQSVPTVKAIKEKIKTARISGDQNEALRLIDLWLDAEPESNSALHLKGRVLLELSRFNDAVLVLQKAATKAPDQQGLAYDLARAKHEQGRFDDVIKICQDLVSNTDANFRDRVRLLWAQTLIDDNRAAEAEPILAALSDQTSASAQILKATVLRAAKKYDDAVGVLKDLLDRDEDIPEAWYDLVLLSMDLQDATGAKDNYNHLNEIAPKLAEDFSGFALFTQQSSATGDQQTSSGSHAQSSSDSAGDDDAL